LIAVSLIKEQFAAVNPIPCRQEVFARRRLLFFGKTSPAFFRQKSNEPDKSPL
jgi:hypothetical protein